MIVHAEARCDIGCVRGNNEDMILVGDEHVRDRHHSARLVVDPAARLVLAVADGMGGAAAGEWASEYALTRLAALVREAPADLDGDELAELLELWAARTHRELLEQGAADGARAGMGTTVAGLLLQPGRAWRFHVGDSRVYRLRDGVLQRLTQDHSLREASGDAATPGNLLVNSLGGGPQSWLEVAAIDDLRPLDRFLVCSDGLHDLVDDDRLAAALAADRGTAALTLVQMARDEGGRDNISALVVDIGRAPAP